jgi:bifunctional NMN adenylyltransferase/nudix hydrolase
MGNKKIIKPEPRVGFIIGRFEPRHKGHENLIASAARQVETLIVIIGSADRPRSIKNPWTYKERATSMKDWLRNEQIDNVRIVPLNDYRYSDPQWLSDVNTVIRSFSNGATDDEIAMFGFDKSGNDYLKWFPQYQYVNIQTAFPRSATDIRDEMLANALAGNQTGIPPEVLADYKFYLGEQKLFSNYPFPETLNFNCGDAVLECAGHILLIQRGKAPGKGCWALPGGFRDRKDVKWIDTAYRELREETNVRIPEIVLRTKTVSTKLYDDINRSFGLPRNTLAVHIRVEPDADGTLPRVSGNDDAADARWVPINEIMNNYDLYDDHKDIIQDMCRVQPLPAHENPRFN